MVFMEVIRSGGSLACAEGRETFLPQTKLSIKMERGS
jgi:hypothetical protein